MTHTDWQPTADIALLQARAQMLQQVRNFFVQRNVWEVETPLVSHYGVSDPHIDRMGLHYQVAGADTDTAFTAAEPSDICYLMSSPEYAMKRLLAAGSGSIYQITKAFRNGEVGRSHNPEFSLLEWYQVDFTLPQLMQEVADLLTLLLPKIITDGHAWHYLTYAQAFIDTLGFDPFVCTDTQLVIKAQAWVDNTLPADTPRDTWLDLLMSHAVEPALPTACMIYDYPASQSALAQVMINEQGIAVAKRFEVYIKGMELANGYQELTDAKEQQARFAADNALRHQLGKTPMTGDRRLIAALSAGMPACSGVALGLDRLLMLVHDKNTIAEVMAFGFARA